MARAAREILEGKIKSTRLDISTIAYCWGSVFTEASVAILRVSRSNNPTDHYYV